MAAVAAAPAALATEPVHSLARPKSVPGLSKNVRSMLCRCKPGNQQLLHLRPSDWHAAACCSYPNRHGGAAAGSSTRTAHPAAPAQLSTLSSAPTAARRFIRNRLGFRWPHLLRNAGIPDGPGNGAIQQCSLSSCAYPGWTAGLGPPRIAQGSVANVTRAKPARGQRGDPAADGGAVSTYSGWPHIPAEADLQAAGARGLP